MSDVVMDWEKLLNDDRRRDSDLKDHRNGFERDYDRIIGSSSLRRLQDKAQVFPLQNNDFIRTRLTHSLEVSALGRSFGNYIGERLVKEKGVKILDFQRKVSALLSVICLVHDIGNPPFGHFGEDVIKNWFKHWFDSDEFKKLEADLLANGKQALTEKQKNDFIYFEGNAQALRILTKLQFLNDEHGINFTYGTLAALIKYPRSSSCHVAALKDKLAVEQDEGEREKLQKKLRNIENHKSYAKFGYFQAEEDTFNDIKEKTGIHNYRHPLTFLMEAADDIAYAAADIEDGVKKGVVPWETVYKEIEEKFSETFDFKYLKDKRDEAKKKNVPNIDMINAQNFRVWAQGRMFEAAAQSFIENYDDIMAGKFDKELIEASKAKELKDYLTKIARKYCYANSEVLSLELVGNSVISGLLEMFVPEIVKVTNENKTKLRENKFFHLISENFRYVHKLEDGVPNKTIETMSLYDKLLLITDFVSGMTDSYAVDLYQRLRGVKLP